MAVTDADAHAEVRVGLRYVVSNEDAYEAFCDALGFEPYDADGSPTHEADVAWEACPNDEANEFFFPRSRSDLD